MTKDELFDVVVKAFGVLFLTLAIMAIPELFKGIGMLIFMLTYGPIGATPDEADRWIMAARPGIISESIGAIMKSVIYIIISMNFLRSGSLVRKLMGKKHSEETEEATNP